MTNKELLESLRMVYYFLKEKDDITRWCGWDKFKPYVREIIPDVMAALDLKQIAEDALETALDRLEDRADKLEFSNE